jgi:hypothetical protein
MNNPNVVYDFTQNNSQPLAIMSATLAKRLLTIMSHRLVGASTSTIIDDFVEQLLQLQRLEQAGDATIQDVINAALMFVEERNLIDNIVAENWNAYKVEQEQPVVDVVEPKRSNNH